MVKLSIVIVNYNGGNIIRECLSSVFSKVKNIDFEVIVSDNGSTDGSVETIKNEFPGIIIVKNGNNIGFAAANNEAVKSAHGEYVLLLNPDTLVLDKNISKLVEFMDKNSQAGACGPQILNSDMTMQRQCKRGWPTFRNSFFYYSGLWKFFPNSRKWKKITGGYFCLEKPDDQICEVDQLSGAALLVRRDIWKKLAGMDEKYIMYWDDTDLCFRIKSLGYKIFYVPQSKIMHYGGVGGAQLHALRNMWYFHNGACIFYHRYLAKKTFFVFNWMYYGGVWAAFWVKFLSNVFRKEKIIGSKKPHKIC